MLIMETNNTVPQENNATAVPKKRVSRTWEAAMRLKGSLIVNDPAFLV